MLVMTNQKHSHLVARSAAVLLVVSAVLGACGDDDTASAGSGDGPSVSFASPGDGDEIAGIVAFELIADGVTIEPAGEVRDGAGHLHVIADNGCVDTGEAISKDADHVHLGDGQSQEVIYLGPGEHELCVQVGDGVHAAQDITDTVMVEVGIDSQEEWCSVVEQTDVRFEEVDTAGEEDFAVARAGYVGIGRLLGQLIDAVDLVDVDVRDDVRSSLENAHEITDAYEDAADIAEAEENFEPIFAGDEPLAAPAAVSWILDTCNVDIDG